jgi:hypothetical protein
MIDSIGRTREAIEVLAQDLAMQENDADAKASPENPGRNEVLISFVLLGLANISAPSWRSISRAAAPPGTLPIRGSMATMSSQARSAASSKSGASAGRTCQPVTSFPNT